MIVIKRGNPPHELTQEIQQLRSEQRTYENLSTPTKDAIKKELLERQGHLCAYCMRRIQDVREAKLEHVYPQARSLEEGHPEQTVAFTNMLVTCTGGTPTREGKTRDLTGETENERVRTRRENLTCDTHKGNELISIDPTLPAHVDTIRYRRDGEISSTDSKFNDDLCITLNLNCRAAHLPQNRQRVYESMVKAIEKRNPKTHKAKQDFARKKLKSLKVRLETAEVKEPFVGVMLFWLEYWSR